MNNMVWNVYYHNFNKNTIAIENIFDHGGFNKGVKGILGKHQTKKEFAEELRMELFTISVLRQSGKLLSSHGAVVETIRASRLMFTTR